MARTTQSDVTAIFDTDTADVDVSAWIDIANELVDDIADADSSIDGTRLTKIEKLLAAHFAATQDPRVAKESRESASVTFEGETGMRINASRYGQQAAMLDPTGTLADAGRRQASVGVPDAKGIDD